MVMDHYRGLHPAAFGFLRSLALAYTNYLLMVSACPFGAVRGYSAISIAGELFYELTHVVDKALIIGCEPLL
jgi:hypothetical protein